MDNQITISSSSFLLPNNQAWEKLKPHGQITHSDYGDWSSSLMNSSAEEIMVQVIFIEDFLGSSNIEHIDLTIKSIINQIISYFSLILKK